jgi:prepilin-type N-terminal cleavage/methylation domain-containing protein
MLSNKTKTPRGFTIVELTVALSVSAMALVTAFELFKALRFVGDRQNQSMVELWEVTNALDQIREDLAYAVPVAYKQEELFTGGNADFEFEEFKLLKFYSLCAADYPGNLSGIRRIHKIEYELVKEKDSICLYRIAIPIIGRNKLPDGENRKLISDKVEKIKISFYDGFKSTTSFSSKQHLPVYVELELTAYGQTWLLAVKLPCGVANVEQAL